MVACRAGESDQGDNTGTAAAHHADRNDSLQPAVSQHRRLPHAAARSARRPHQSG